MKNIFAFTFAFTLTASLFAAEPKVACTISFDDSIWAPKKNSSFRTRPICEQMLKDGIDICLYRGWKKKEESVTSLKQFNSLWLITEHEAMCTKSAAEVASALKGYVEAGGGLVFCFSAGRYPEAPVDAYWTEVMKTFGAEILHEEIYNPETEVRVDKCRKMFHTDDFADHPVTKGIRGLWLADRFIAGTWGSVAVKYSPEWEVVARGGKGSRSVPKNRRTNELEPDKAGTYAHDAPIVAVRQFGKGRIVFVASHKDTCGWLYGVDKWPNYTERSNYAGKPSDMVGLIENALKWTSEPSMGDPTFVKHYKPIEYVAPPYKPLTDLGKRERETPKYPALAPATRKPGARGLVGVHSSHSDGKSSVAEYVVAAKKAGLNFLVFTDPLEFLTAEKLAALRDDCAKNSSDDFYCCPGVEYIDSSDCEWALWHDKVEFPDPKPFLRDGRYYKLFDGKRILQRNQYGGHQNLYRGVLLNMKRVEEIGNDLINLAYFNAITPKVYDEGKLVFDNYPQYLKTAHNLHRAAMISFTRVRKAADVASAAKLGQTCGDNLKVIRGWANAKGGWGGHEGASRAHLQAEYGAGAEILGFDVARASGFDLYKIALHVACPAGVAEVALLDGNRRVLARLDAKGVKDFSTILHYSHDRQSHLILEVKGKDGSMAYSNPLWIFYYHAGMMRCGDNSNLLSQNPGVMHFINWDDSFIPPYKHITRRPGVVRIHGGWSEAVLWEDMAKIPSRFPSASCWGERSPIRLRGIGYPSEQDGMPSSHTCSTLNQPNVVSIFDQDFGEYIMDPMRTEKNATYSMCSPVGKIAEGRYWRRRHRVYQFVDRHDGWWRATHGSEAPDYRGAYTIAEGRILFTENVELAQPVELVRIAAGNPSRPVEIYERGADVFRANSYYALVSDDSMWYALFGLAGADDLRIAASGTENSRKASLVVGKAGQKFKKGDKLDYRFAVGSFREPVIGGQYCEWFARMMNGEGFNHGTAKVNGIIDVVATDGMAELEAGSTWFIQNYPVRIHGLVDNGAAYMTDGAKITRPLGFAGSKAYASIPLEERKTWKFMNYFLADNADLRFTWIPKMPEHEKEAVEISNPTDKAITAKVRDLVRGGEFSVTVPARGLVVR